MAYTQHHTNHKTSSSLFMNKNDGTNLINFRVLIEKKIYGLNIFFPKTEFIIFLCILCFHNYDIENEHWFEFEYGGWFVPFRFFVFSPGEITLSEKTK